VIVVSSQTQRLSLGNISGIEVSCSTLWFANANRIQLGCGRPVQDGQGIWHILWSMHSSYEELFRMKGLVSSPDTEVLAICDPILDDASLGRGNSTLLTSSGRLHAGARDAAESPATDTDPGPNVRDFVRETIEFFAPRNLDDPLLKLLTDEDREPCTREALHTLDYDLDMLVLDMKDKDGIELGELEDRRRAPCTPTVQESPLTHIDTPSPKRCRTLS
jgi:hypothetical protein